MTVSYVKENLSIRQPVGCKFHDGRCMQPELSPSLAFYIVLFSKEEI
jgi:hypothetical protein